MSTVPNEGPANTSDTPVCGLAGTRADVRCNGPVIWRVIYYRGEGSHRAQAGRIESVCFGHADYEERWTRAARMVTYARMELTHGSTGEAVQLRKAGPPAVFVGEHGPEPWSQADADRMRGINYIRPLEISVNGRPFSIDDCTHGDGCPVHPKTHQLHNFDPTCGLNTIHDRHPYMVISEQPNVPTRARMCYGGTAFEDVPGDEDK